MFVHVNLCTMVKSAHRVTQILEAVASSRAGLRHADIAGALKIPKGSLSLLLADLASQEYLAVREDEGRRYVLGPQVLVIAKRYLSGLDLVRLGQPILRNLVAATDECGEIAVRRMNEILMVCREDCSSPLRSVIQIGDRAPIYATAAGKAILAHLPPDEIKGYLSTVRLKPITKKTITSLKTLKEELEAIRAGALAYSHEELNEGLIAIGSPVFDLSGQVKASMVVPVPAIRYNARKEKKIERLLREAASRLSHQLGYEDRSRSVDWNLSL
jgi:DNA-binding IclR family transcriptional regulator